MKDQFKPGQIVEVRDNSSQNWEIRTFVAKVDLPHPYLTHGKNQSWGMTYAECRIPCSKEFMQQRIAELEEEISKLKNQ